MGKRASLLPFRAAIVLHRDAGVCFDAESVVPERPLVFIEERGLWTVRVDFETHLDPQTPGLQSSLLHQTAPSPVIQEGDEVDGSTVTSITTLDPLAVPSRRPYGSSYLPIAAETFHRLCGWRHHRDEDYPGGSSTRSLGKRWHRMDGDGFIELDLPVKGVNPFRRDRVYMGWPDSPIRPMSFPDPFF